MMTTSEAPKTVLLVEDDDHTRRRLRQSIDNHDDLQILSDCASVSCGRQALHEGRPDVLVTDLGLPDGSGIELIQQAREAYGDTIEIMVITVFGDEHNVLHAIEAGASSYLLKDGDTDYIGEAILKMLDGESPISAAIARQLLKRYRNPATTAASADSNAQNAAHGTEAHNQLTERETEVLRAMAKGYTYNEAAKLLDMSSHTVASHIKKIYRKLNVNSRSEAVYEAMQRGIVEID